MVKFVKRPRVTNRLTSADVAMYIYVILHTILNVRKVRRRAFLYPTNELEIRWLFFKRYAV